VYKGENCIQREINLEMEDELCILLVWMNDLQNLAHWSTWNGFIVFITAFVESTHTQLYYYALFICSTLIFKCRDVQLGQDLFKSKWMPLLLSIVSAYNHYVKLTDTSKRLFMSIQPVYRSLSPRIFYALRFFFNFFDWSLSIIILLSVESYQTHYILVYHFFL
jgi:hypothetical protein